MKKILILSLIAASIFSCNKQEIPTYSGDHYINFTKDADDFEAFTFITAPGQDKAVVGIPVELAGFKPSKDVPFEVSVVSSGDNATTATDAEFKILPTVFRADHYVDGNVVDSVFIEINKTAVLDTKELLLTLKIENSEFAKQGLPEKLVNTLRFGNIKSRPSWWTDDYSAAFYGEYSDIKYDQLINSILEMDPDFNFATMGKLSIEDHRTLARNLVYYLRKLKDQGKEVFEEDGVTPMLETITIIA